MTLLTPSKLRLRRRIRQLPVASHNCEAYGIWVRRPKVTGRLVCAMCGRP